MRSNDWETVWEAAVLTFVIAPAILFLARSAHLNARDRRRARARLPLMTAPPRRAARRRDDVLG